MKKAKVGEMRPEYDRSSLGRGVRGKYLKAYGAGTNLVLLSPDVAEAFPDETAVNEALRSLIKVARQSVPPAKRQPRRPKTRTVSKDI
jgi:hypothetical protein